MKATERQGKRVGCNSENQTKAYEKVVQEEVIRRDRWRVGTHMLHIYCENVCLVHVIPSSVIHNAKMKSMRAVRESSS